MFRILVPTDFSDNAHAALRYAAGLAAATEAEVVLAHVLVRSKYPDGTLKQEEAAATEKAREAARLQLQEQADQLQTEFIDAGRQVKISCHLLHNTFTDGIGQLAEQENCRLIIMGTQGASGLKRIFIGSNTTDLMEHSRIPLITIPKHYNFSGLSRIVLALEIDKPHLLSPHLQIIRELAVLFNSELLLLAVLKPGQKVPSPEMHTGTALKERLGDERLTYLTIENDDPAEAITGYAEKEKPDLVVLHPQPRTVWQLLFNKMVSRELVFGPHVPVMTMPLPE